MSLRTFVAIPLSDGLRTALCLGRDAILTVDPTWRQEKWVADENLHVTLKFIGQLEAADVDRVADALAAEAALHPPFDLRIDRLRQRPARGKASMIWAVVSGGSAPAVSLAEGVDTVLADSIGLEKAKREFKPHVTVARTRRPRHIDPAAIVAGNDSLWASGKIATSMSVACVTLISSRLGRTGPTYETLGSLPLGG